MDTLLITYGLYLTVYSFLFRQCCQAAARKANSIMDMVYGNGSEKAILQKQVTGMATLLIAVIFFLCTQSNTSQIMMFPGIGNWLYAWIAAAALSLFTSTLHTMAATRKLKQQYHHSINTAVLYWYFPGRVVFLLLYEFFFRGILLFGIASLLGTAGSVCINIVLYTGLHAYSSREELAATIPFGLVTCYLSLASGSVIPAAVLHILVSLTNELMITGSVNRSLKIHTV
ncbi:MAG TPA: CPBP family intramembrane metalloprotease [Ferruginibacter sp.]|nr:hypothetical protein [Chitinophagaceae bacterium]HRI23265.1 CPBP family intramembrane metalloprotease [Ferruginibacter sp.]